MAISKLKFPKICLQCGNPFEAKTVTTVYCSRPCIDKANRIKKQQALEEQRTQALLQEKAEIIADIQTRPYITIAEAVVLFGISKNTMHRLIKAGKVPAINLGQRLTRVSRVHIESMFTVLPVPVLEAGQENNIFNTHH
jgi:excisionase family DNA binding protein